jgi:hypothetical protein
MTLKRITKTPEDSYVRTKNGAKSGTLHHRHDPLEVGANIFAIFAAERAPPQLL